MKFARVRDCSMEIPPGCPENRGLVPVEIRQDIFELVEPAALLNELLNVVARCSSAGAPQTVLNVIAEVDRWQVLAAQPALGGPLKFDV